jgi:hypothetical protein
MWAKIAQMAPIILASGAAIGLVVIKVDDPKTQRMLRAIAVALAIGTVFSVIQQLPTVIAALEDTKNFGLRLFGMDAASVRQRIEEQRVIEAAKAKAEQERRDEANRAEMDRLRAEAAKKKAIDDGAAAEQKAIADRAEAKRRADQAEQQARIAAAKAADDARQDRERREAEARRQRELQALEQERRRSAEVEAAEQRKYNAIKRCQDASRSSGNQAAFAMCPYTANY